MEVDHPYAGNSGNYADASGTMYIRAGGSYVLVNGWGEISRGMVEKHRKLLAQNRHNAESKTAEPVLGESLAMLSNQWLAQCSRMDELTGPLTGTYIIHHHWIGVCGQNDSPYIILFIDEAHTLIGAGGAAGSSDAANMLKPALARGELRTIAATTWSEYKKYVEKDAALARRFQVVKIEEPDEIKAMVMMRAIAPFLENHHDVMITDDALRDVVHLSHRYITAR